MGHKTYNNLQEKFEILKQKNPNDSLLKYQEIIKPNDILAEDRSDIEEEFMKTFGIPYGTEHKYVLKKCLYVIKTRIKDIEKESNLEEKLKSEVQTGNLTPAIS